jgi:tetratricopeptide (TPR) repeat protein
MRLNSQGRWIACIIIILIAASVAYSNTLFNGMVWDDNAILDGGAIRSLGLPNIARFFTDRDAYHAPGEIYRPLYLLSFAIDYALYSTTAWGYHLTNLILHALSSLLVFVFFLHLLGPRTTDGSTHGSVSPFLPALIATVIFAVHPVHTESVAWIKGRDDLLAAFFMLGSFILYLRSGRTRTLDAGYIGAVALFVLALLSKEMVVTLPVLLILYDLCFRPRRLKSISGLAAYVPFFAVALLYLIVRTYVLGQIGQMEYLGGGFGPAMFNMAKAMVVYFKLLIVPIGQCADYLGFPIKRVVDSGVILSFLLVGVVLGVGVVSYRYSRLVAFSVLWFFIAMLPVAHIIPIRISLAERFLYIPSIGFTLLFGVVAAKAFEPGRRRTILKLFAACFITVIALYMYGTVARNRVWRDGFTLWSDVILKYPSERAHVNYGLAYEKAGNVDEAVRQYELALRINPAYSVAVNNLANNYFRLDRIDEATSLYLRALYIDPGNAVIHSRLGTAYWKNGFIRKAIMEFETALRIDPGLTKTRDYLDHIYRGLEAEGRAIE